MTLAKGIELDSPCKNQNVSGHKALKKGKSLILFTACNIDERRHATYKNTPRRCLRNRDSRGNQKRCRIGGKRSGKGRERPVTSG